MVVSGVLCARAQEVVQPLSISLTVYNQTNGIVRPIHISTRDIIRYFAGTNVPGGKLLLVSPAGSPATSDNLGASLRITGNNDTVIDISSPVSFNLFQDFSTVAQTISRTTTYALNRFSIDFGGFHAELQGLSIWSANATTPGGEGSFRSTVNGQCIIDGISSGNTPCQGTITGAAPKSQ